MNKTFVAFVAVATIAGSLAATPASAQRGVTAPGRYYEPAPYGAGRGPYDDFGGREWVHSVSMTAISGGSAGCESAAARLNGIITTIDVERGRRMTRACCCTAPAICSSVSRPR